MISSPSTSAIWTERRNTWLHRQHAQKPRPFWLIASSPLWLKEFRKWEVKCSAAETYSRLRRVSLIFSSIQTTTRLYCLQFPRRFKACTAPAVRGLILYSSVEHSSTHHAGLQLFGLHCSSRWKKIQCRSPSLLSPASLLSRYCPVVFLNSITLKLGSLTSI